MLWLTTDVERLALHGMPYQGSLSVVLLLVGKVNLVVFVFLVYAIDILVGRARDVVMIKCDVLYKNLSGPDGD